jgi:hypothetical protein
MRQLIEETDEEIVKELHKIVINNTNYHLNGDTVFFDGNIYFYNYNTGIAKRYTWY